MKTISEHKMMIGTVGIEPQNLPKLLEAASDCGIEVVDTAWLYEVEEDVGRAVHEFNEKYPEKRMYIQSKMWPEDYHDYERAFKRALKNLHTNQIYSYMMHRPSLNFRNDVKVWKFLIEMKQQGKIKHLGVSNYERDMIEILKEESGFYPEFNQIELSVINWREDRVNYARKKGIHLQAWSPLHHDPIKILNNPEIIEIAKNHNCTSAQVALAYISNQDITIIFKTSHPERIRENNNAQFIKLSDKEIQTIKGLNDFDIAFNEIYEGDKLDDMPNQ